MIIEVHAIQILFLKNFFLHEQWFAYAILIDLFWKIWLMFNWLDMNAWKIHRFLKFILFWKWWRTDFLILIYSSFFEFIRTKTHFSRRWRTIIWPFSLGKILLFLFKFNNISFWLWILFIFNVFSRRKYVFVIILLIDWTLCPLYLLVCICDLIEGSYLNGYVVIFRCAWMILFNQIWILILPWTITLIGYFII